MSLAALIAPEEVRERLERIFPAEFPDRTILVGPSAARTVFVALYGGFVGGTRCFRPSTIINFSNEQAALASEHPRASRSRVPFRRTTLRLFPPVAASGSD